MSEIERNKVEDMDTIVDVVTEAQEADRRRVVPVADQIEDQIEDQTEDQTEGQTTEQWAVEMVREFERNRKRWHRRKGWGAFGLACFHSLNVMACCAALLGNYWQLVLVGLAAANLMMVGGWMSKAKAGWSV